MGSCDITFSRHALFTNRRRFGIGIQPGLCRGRPVSRRQTLRPVAVRFAFALIGCVTFGCQVAHANANDQIVPIVLTGSHVPDMPAGTVFADFGNLTLSRAGHIAFTGNMANSQVSEQNNTGLWVGFPDDLNLIAREGDPALGTEADTRFGDFGSALRVSSYGVIAFTNVLTGPAITGNTNNIGLWSSQGGLHLAIRRGAAVDGGGAVSTIWGWLFSPNNSGELMISADIGNSSTVFIEDGGNLSPVVSERDKAPGTNETFQHLYATGFNSAYQIPFYCYVGTLDTLWIAENNTLRRVACENEFVPGTGLRYTGAIRGGRITDAGQMLFSARVQEASGPDLTALLMDELGTIRPLVVEGDPAPGMAPDYSLGDITLGYLSESGDIAFCADVEGPDVTSANDRGIWAGQPDALPTRRRDGDPAPGTPEGVSFQLDSSYIANETGRIALLGNLDGPGVNSGNNVGLWAEDIDGLTLIAQGRNV